MPCVREEIEDARRAQPIAMPMDQLRGVLRQAGG